MSTAAALDLVGIEKKASLDYLERVFECYREGRVVVPVDPAGTAPEGHAFAERITPEDGGGWFARAQAPVRDDGPAQISFSSGTTGTPKAILLSHRALADVTDRLIAVMEIDAEISEYLGVPPTYSFGLARARVIAAVGGKLYVPPRGFDPTEFVRMLEAGEINALSAVPTLLRVLIANPDLIGRKAARKLRWLEIGSQAMSAEDKRAVRRMFPAARIVQHYGLTEASRTTFLDLQEASDDELESVGRPIGATEVRVDGEGHVCIRGPHVANGILTGDGLQPITDGDGWLRTNDLGRIDDRGFLYFLGRADHLLNVGGIKVPAELFEEKLAELIGGDAAHVAVAGLEDAMRGQVVMVAHTASVTPAALAGHARTVGSGFGLGAADVRLVEVGEIPRTETGKVRRDELGKDALVTPAVVHALVHPEDKAPAPVVDSTSTPVAAPAAAAHAASAPGGEQMSEREAAIAQIWRDALGVASIGRNDTFFDLGGDSLSAINAMLRMERAGIPKEITQQIFEGRSVAEIAANVDGGARQPVSKRVEVSDAITLTRGLVILVVIASHWLPFLLVRAGSYSEALVKWTSPFFRFGTPAFAVVYGIGLTFFNMMMVQRHPERLKANIRTNVLILAGGIVTLAVVNSALLLELGQRERITISFMFYGVLTTYAILVAISGVVLRFVAARKHQLLTLVIMGLASLFVSSVVRGLWEHSQTTGVVDLVRLLLVTKYGVPEMFGYVCLGAAMGLWIDWNHEADELPGQAVLAGIALLVASALLTETLHVQSSWFEQRASAQMLVAFVGGVLILFGLILQAIRNGLTSGPFKVPARVLMMVGILAFLFYVAHMVAESLSRIVEAMGVPYAVGVASSVGLFLAVSAFAVRRLYRLYYGS